MRALGFDKLVTGHYARVTQVAQGVYTLARAADAEKDQSYFLCGVAREKLGHIIFPLGDLTKGDVRAIAAEAGFANAAKCDSQDVCFIADDGHAGFIESYRGRAPEPGNFVDPSGRVLGRHSGIVRYTVGQRKGLGVALGRPVYVKEIRPGTNEVVLVYDEGDVFAVRIEVADMNWLVGDGAGMRKPGASFRAQVVIRYGAPPVWATIGQGADGRLRVVFDAPVRTPAKGQAAVFYDGDTVLGGGRIV